MFSNIKKAIKKILRFLKSRLTNLMKQFLFVGLVFIPTVLSTLYFGLIASDVYISESKFIVRAPQQQVSGSALGVLLQGTSFARAQDDSYTVQDYIESRSSIKDVAEQIDIISVYKSNNIDWFSKFDFLGFDDSFESFYKYISKRVKVSQNSFSSITTLRVKAYTPEDALEINDLILGNAEELVNELNIRARRDLIKFAEEDVAFAKKRADQDSRNLAKYRNDNQIVDPEKQSLIQLQVISKMQDELVKAKSLLTQIKVSAPKNPQISSLENMISSIEQEIINELQKSTGKEESFSSQSPEYQRLIAESIFSEKQLAAALLALDSAITESRKQQFYLERIVDPILPDKAIEPKRLTSIIATILISIAIWGLVSLLLGSIREHRD